MYLNTTTSTTSTTTTSTTTTTTLRTTTTTPTFPPTPPPKLPTSTSTTTTTTTPTTIARCKRKGFDIVIGHDLKWNVDDYNKEHDRVREFANYFEIGKGEGQARLGAIIRNTAMPKFSSTNINLNDYTTNSGFVNRFRYLYESSQAFWVKGASVNSDQPGYLRYIVDNMFTNDRNVEVQKIAIMFMIGLNKAKQDDGKYIDAGRYAFLNNVRTYVIQHTDYSQKWLKLTVDRYREIGSHLAYTTLYRQVYFAKDSKPEGDMYEAFKEIYYDIMCQDLTCNKDWPKCKELKEKERKLVEEDNKKKEKEGI
ncbi:hypothetical protein L596_022652 [Steinernema carpocapsae]|nr:hypothetical protein L596_022652 [Steinernema carpocapsae]